MNLINLNQKSTNKAADIIKKGGTVIFPTDTVYGFLADAGNKKAVEKIFRIKKRAKSNPLPVFVKDLKMAKTLAEISAKQEKMLKKKWPGKYTFVLRRKKGINLFGIDKKTIALRIPKHKFLNSLLRRANRPLAQTSVNISGKLPITNIGEIIMTFEKQKNRPDSIVGAGNLKKSKPSVIIDLARDNIKILRP